MEETQERVRKGPCGAPECPDFDNPTGQWQFIPDGFDKPVVRDATCTCKKAVCMRYFGLKPPKQKPGRKPNQRAAAERPGKDDPCLPAIYGVRKIEEVWGERFANIGTMHPDERRNELPASSMRAEYVVHGWFGKKSLAEDKNGFAGAYWVPLKRICQGVG